MPLGRGTPPAHTASPGGLNRVKAASLLKKSAPTMHPDAVECIARVFCDTVQGTDSRDRFIDLAAAFKRNEQLVQDAVLAYEQAVRGHEGDMRKLVRKRANELATPERMLQLSANKQRAMETSQFSPCFRPVMDQRGWHEQQMLKLQKSRVGSVSNLGD